MNFEIPPLKYRLLFGLIFFIFMGIRDYLMNPNDPKRLKEYLFITFTSLVAISFAIIHDLVTFSISTEYFSIAKGLGPNVKFFPDVVVLATKASYWVGIFIGLIFVLFNNPSKRMPQLNYSYLTKICLIPFTAASTSAVIAFLLSQFSPPIFSKGGEGIIQDTSAFEAVAFIHWGTYLGALVGLLLSALLIKRARNKTVSIHQTYKQ